GELQNHESTAASHGTRDFARLHTDQHAIQIRLELPDAKLSEIPAAGASSRVGGALARELSKISACARVVGDPVGECTPALDLFARQIGLRVDADCTRSKSKLLPLLEHYPPVGLMQIVFAHANSSLESQVQELGLEHLPADFTPILSLVETTSRGLLDQALDADAVLGSDPRERIVDLFGGHDDARSAGRPLLELLIDHALDQRLVELGNCRGALGAVRNLLMDLEQERTRPITEVAEQDPALPDDRDHA